MTKGIDISKFQAGLKITDAKKAGYDFETVQSKVNEILSK